MTRRILLASLAAVLSVAAFVLIFGGGQPTAAPDAPAEARMPFITRSTTQPDKVIEGGELRLTPGDKTFVRIYDRVTGEQKYVFRADRWEPVSDVEFHLTRPDVRIHMPDGQITYIRSNEGQVVLSQTGRHSIDPKRGWLRGDLRITIDRTTKKWRAEHPDEAELEQHPEQTINIFLDEVSFDLDRSRLESTSELRVQSVEADIHGTGLELAWNQVDNRIEYLTIKKGKQMELRRGGGMIDFAMPGTQRTHREPRERRDPPREPRRPSVPASTDEALAASVMPVGPEPSAADAAAWLRDVAAGRTITAKPPDPGAKNLTETAETMMGEARAATDRGSSEPIATTVPADPDAPRRRKIDTYSAVFTGDVVVEQRQGLRRPGRITCDKLEVVFDFGQRLKKATTQLTPRRPGAPATQPARDDDSPIDAQDTTRLVLNWTGPLEMRPLNMPPEQQTGERFDCIATGRQVIVDDGRGNAACRQLVYRNERQQVWLAGDESEPVVLVTAEEPVEGDGESAPRAPAAKGRLTGREVFFDRQRGIARVDGPGEMLQARRPAATQPAVAPTASEFAGGGNIRWSRGMEIELKQVQEQRPDPATGQLRTIARDYISRAWIHGKVRVERGDERVRGEDIEATFAPPARAGASMGAMARLDASGNVRLERRPDLIIAKKLTVDFEPTPDGRDSTPKTAVAEGNVVAVQDRRRISGDRVAVSLARLTEPPATTQPGARPRVQLAMTELHATGDVRAVDPDQRFRVRSEELHARIPDGRKFQAATVVGRSADRFAFVAYGDYELAGQRIETDMTRQTADINGPGRAYFVSDRDFGGGELKKAEKTRVEWTRSMRVRGADNVAIFDGDVRSTTPTHSLTCDKLSILLAEVATPPRSESPRPPASPAERFRRKPHPIWGYADAYALAGWDVIQQTWGQLRPKLAPLEPPSRPKTTANAPAVVFGTASGRTKQPVRVNASGNAVALRTVRNPRSKRLISRIRIAGNEIAVDLRRQSMNVPGKGSLLIEDYQLKGEPIARRADRPSLFGGSDGPSQTLFLWDNGMSYFGDQALVTFDRQVVMRHVSGQNVVLKDDLAAAMKVDPRTLRLPTGRQADLTCDNLLVQFLRTSAEQAETLDVRGADLRQLVASGSVHLQEATKSLMGERLTYSRETNRITVEGSADFEARIFDQDEASQRFNMWRGPLLIWDRNGDRIEARNSQFTSRSGR